MLGAAKRQAQEHRASSRMWWATAIAAAMLVVVRLGVAVSAERTGEEEAAGKEAKARLELALKITSVKLQRISIKVEGIQQN